MFSGLEITMTDMNSELRIRFVINVKMTIVDNN
jgi:hypothetical protein